jgi:uncharacterized protein (TIGR02646 family)
MRKIDPHLVAADRKWDRLATAARLAVSRGSAPSEHAKVWAGAKKRLKAASHGKCWYCEARQDRSDNAVDHFRPKSQYPWLAFTIGNLRYSCTFCNSVRRDEGSAATGGKGDNFPVFNPPRASVDGELANEDIVLIDPCRGADVAIIDFVDDGSTCASDPAHVKRKRRAEESIRFYHLNHRELIEGRRLLALQLKDWIAAANDIYPMIDQGSTKIDSTFAKLAEILCRAMSEKAQFSVFARRIIGGHRNLVWVESLLRCT